MIPELVPLNWRLRNVLTYLLTYLLRQCNGVALTNDVIIL